MRCKEYLEKNARRTWLVCASLGLQCTQLLGFQLRECLRECHMCVLGKAQLQRRFTHDASLYSCL